MEEFEQFDIKNHVFEDGDIESAGRAMGGRLFLFLSDGGHLQLCREDVKAMAAHYGLINL